MSAYITFYIKRPNDDYYIELDTWSRSTKMFHYLSDLAYYENCVEVSKKDLNDLIESARIDKAKYENLRDKQEESMKFCASIPVNTAEAIHELLEELENYKESIEEFNSEIEEIEEVISQLNTYESIAENISGSWRSEAIANLYLAYEMDPNYQENNEENKISS